jgi:hypothetical protein
LKKNVRDRLKHGGDAVDRTALPPFGVSHLSLSFGHPSRPRGHQRVRRHLPG